MRYRLPGALLAGVLGAAMFIPLSMHRADLTGETYQATTYIFAVGLMGLIAGSTGIMAENWKVQKNAFERQALKLAEADRIKDRFLAITSHEFRGPLAAIIMGVDTVSKRRDRLTPEQLDKLLEMVSSQGNQLARLVDDLLITSQLQTHQLNLQPDWCDLQVAIDRALEGGRVEAQGPPARDLRRAAQLCAGRSSPRTGRSKSGGERLQVHARALTRRGHRQGRKGGPGALSSPTRGLGSRRIIGSSFSRHSAGSTRPRPARTEWDSASSSSAS